MTIIYLSIKTSFFLSYVNLIYNVTGFQKCKEYVAYTLTSAETIDLLPYSIHMTTVASKIVDKKYHFVILESSKKCMSDLCKNTREALCNFG